MRNAARITDLSASRYLTKLNNKVDAGHANKRGIRSQVSYYVQSSGLLIKIINAAMVDSSLETLSSNASGNTKSILEVLTPRRLLATFVLFATHRLHKSHGTAAFNTGFGPLLIKASKRIGQLQSNSKTIVQLSHNQKSFDQRLET